MNTKLYTISQAANIIGVHKDTLRRWERQGKIQSFRVRNGWRRFYEEDIERLMQGEVR